MDPLIVPPAALVEIVRACRAALPNEACGFIVNDRVVVMRNIHPDPIAHCRMDDEQVVEFYRQCDAAHEEPGVAWHSHPTSQPYPSDEDRTAWVDPYLAYLIVSLDGRTSGKAYRVKHEFIGQSIVTEVPILSGPPPIRMPIGPLILTPGNLVRIAYTRPTRTPLSYAMGETLDLTPDFVKLRPDRSRNPSMPAGLTLERIREVTLLHEGDNGKALRTDLQNHAATLAELLAHGALTRVAEILKALDVAFPANVTILGGPHA